MAPHTVSHDEEIVVRHDGKGVFVVLALQPHIRETGGNYAHHLRDSPK